MSCNRAIRVFGQRKGGKIDRSSCIYNPTSTIQYTIITDYNVTMVTDYHYTIMYTPYRACWWGEGKGNYVRFKYGVSLDLFIYRWASSHLFITEELYEWGGEGVRERNLWFFVWYNSYWSHCCHYWQHDYHLVCGGPSPRHQLNKKISIQPTPLSQQEPKTDKEFRVIT